MRIRAAGIVIHKDKLLFMKRFRDGGNYFVLPGGGVEKNEKAEEAVIREIMEETSLKVRVLHSKNHLSHEFKYKDAEETVNEQKIFICSYVSGEAKLHESSMEAKINNPKNFYELWIDLKEIKNLNIKPPGTKEIIISHIQEILQEDDKGEVRD